MALFSKKAPEQSLSYFSLSLSEVFSRDLDLPSALKNPVVASIITMIANTVASLPLQVRMYAKGGGISSGSWTPEAKLLGERPNSYQTPYSFFYVLVLLLLTKGEAFVIKNRDKNGPTSLVLYVESVEVGFNNGIKTYRLQNGKVLTDNEVIHILHNTLNGITALDPLQQHKDAITLDNTLRRYTKKYFQNSANPSMWASVSGTSNAEALKQATAGFSGDFVSVENAGKIPFLPENVKLNPITSNARDAMLIESLKYSLETLCRIFNIPPSKIGSKEGANYNSLEAENIAFLTNTIQPIVQKIESAFDAGLFYGTAFFVKFNTSAILRATTLERYNAHRVALGGNPFLTQNEVRALEDRNALEGADQLFRMLNLADVNMPFPDPNANTTPNATPQNKVRVKRVKTPKEDI